MLTLGTSTTCWKCPIQEYPQPRSPIQHSQVMDMYTSILNMNYS
ncbi:hypothetical protein DsansV1_C26g0191091 [Dioscorea sansibarensis]